MSTPSTMGLDRAEPPGTLTFSLAAQESNKHESSHDTAALPQRAPKLRSACDGCHRSKVRCSGGLPCSRCKEFATDCVYSSSARAGKPKGSRSRKTIEREKRAAALNATESQVAVQTESLGPDHIRCPTIPASEAVVPISTADINPSSMDAGTAAPSTSIDPISTMSWAATDCVQSMYHNDADISQTLENSSATFWDPARTWTSSTLDALNQFFPDSPSTTRTSWSGSDSLALHRLLPTHPATSKCQCLTSMAALVTPLTTLVATMSTERTDQFLLLMRKTCLACSMYCDCTTCAKDTAAITLVTTVIQLIAWLAEKSVVGSREDAVNVSLQLGMYDVCDDDEHQILVRGLVACRLRKLLAAAVALRDTVQASANSSEEEDCQRIVLDLAGEMVLAPQLAYFDQSLQRLQICQDKLQLGS